MKTKVFAIFALLLCTTMFFTGCSEDDDNGSLSGTVWVGGEVGNESEILTLSFKESTFDYTVTENGEEYCISSGTYEYTSPIVTLTITWGKESEEGPIVYATISSNTMYLNDLVFTKQ